MKLSIITICYNEKQRINKTCQSISCQSNNEFEWIVIDGASNDGTLDVLKEYSSYMSVFLSEADSGIYNAMNKGIAHAKGDYLLFLNAGDFLANEYVVENFHKINKENKDIIVGDIFYENLNGRIYPACYFNRSRGSIKKTLDMGYTFFHQSTFIKKRLFEEYGNYDEKYKIAGDYDFFLRTAVKYKCNVNYTPFFVSTFFMEGLGRDEKQKHIWTEEVNRAIKNNYDKYYLFFRMFVFKKGKYLRRMERFFRKLYKIFSRLFICEMNVIISHDIYQKIDTQKIIDLFDGYRTNIYKLKRDDIEEIVLVDDNITIPFKLSNYLNESRIRKRLGRNHLLLIRGCSNGPESYKLAYITMMKFPEDRVIYDTTEDKETINHAYNSLDFEMIFNSRKYKYDMKTRVVK